MIVYPPNIIKTIFLGGTIDNGNSIDWQKDLSDKIDKRKSEYQEFIYLNPRREDWDSSWGPESTELVDQIRWELDNLEKCDIIVMRLLGTSKSPISLLELGLFARSNKLVVFCDKDFYRYTNVKVTCDKYGIIIVNSEEELIRYILNNGKNTVF